MKVLFSAFLLICSSSAFAGGFKEIAIMATESAEEYLSLNDGDNSYQILSQDLKQSEENASLAVETKLEVRSAHSGRTTEWTCVTQFVKTASFYVNSKTECKN